MDKDKPNPGSDEAIKAGCTCPVLDNGHGKGSGYTFPDGTPSFWYSPNCPVHCSDRMKILDELTRLGQELGGYD